MGNGYLQCMDLLTKQSFNKEQTHAVDQLMEEYDAYKTKVARLNNALQNCTCDHPMRPNEVHDILRDTKHG